MAEILRGFSYKVRSTFITKFGTTELFILILEDTIIHQSPCCYVVTTSKIGLHITRDRRYVDPEGKSPYATFKSISSFAATNWITSNLHKNTDKLTRCDPRFLPVIVSDLAFTAHGESVDN